MYNPVKDGIKKTVQYVQYSEAIPPSDLVGLVHSFWELKTNTVLGDDFFLHVLPDACINILFNLSDPKIAAITARHTTYVELNLGKSFHYVGIQFLPGMWQGNRNEIVHGFVDTPYKGNLPLPETATKLTQLDFSAGQLVLSELVRQLVEKNLVVNNVVTTRILADIEVIDTVTDMAASANLSPRQLQRTLKKKRDFLRTTFLRFCDCNNLSEGII
ncbi:DUF6597 domain-containing transcriptional factor [Leptospira abararensis]|uniref:DUF6597 domain-containing transcriptional factor n=1 Tax=Leptospira abararensis TaxID=2810036 RepID=UPI001E4FE821|nr:DUF6597 domain-containing transcriptional factor [Leptospira abararensis]